MVLDGIESGDSSMRTIIILASDASPHRGLGCKGPGWPPAINPSCQNHNRNAIHTRKLRA